jgi:hypothetical protein
MGCTQGGIKKKMKKEDLEKLNRLVTCFDETDEKDLGFEFVQEKAQVLIKDIKLSAEICTEFENRLNGQLVFPETKVKLKEVYEAELNAMIGQMKEDLKVKNNIEFSDSSLKVFLKSEVYYPISSKNKQDYVKLVFELVKNFVNEIKLFRRLNYEHCRDFVVKHYEAQGMAGILNYFLEAMKSKKESTSRFWDAEVRHKDDHILEAYSVFDHNVNTTLRIVLLFFEKTNFVYQILSINENKTNCNILVNNFIVWSLKNIERMNFPVFKYYLSELMRINMQINDRIGKKVLVSLIHEFKGETSQFLDRLKAIKHEILSKLFLTLNNTSTVLYKPLKEKFNFNFKKLIKEVLPSIYNQFNSVRPEIERILKKNFYDYFRNYYQPFSKKLLVGLNKGLTSDSADDFLVSAYKLIMYYQAKIYGKKYNLESENFKRRTTSLFDLFKSQLEEETVDELREVKDLVLGSEGSLAVSEALAEAAKAFVKEYNSNKVSRDFHLYTIFSFFVCLSGVELNSGDNNNFFKQFEYLSCSRYIINKIVLNLRNYDYELNNWTIVKNMEYLIEDYLEEFNNSNAVKIENISDLTFLQKLRSNDLSATKKILTDEKTFTKLAIYLKFSMAQDFEPRDLQDKFDIEQVLSNPTFKDYFFWFEPLFQRQTGSNSRHIIIFISNYVNQVQSQEELWKEYIGREEFSEYYSFHWPTMDTFSFEEIKIQMATEYADNNVKNDFFNIGINIFEKSHIQGVKLESLDQNPYYRSLYYMAVFAGKALGFFLGQMKLFESSVITLVGYSTGCVVAYNCLRDLYFMKKSNMIYNLVTIASPLSKNKLDPEILKLFVGSLFNVYSNDDKVLKYIGNLGDEFYNPCGLNEVTYENTLYGVKNIKINNLDLTENVHCHSDYPKYLDQIADFVMKSDENQYIAKLLEDI